LCKPIEDTLTQEPQLLKKKHLSPSWLKLNCFFLRSYLKPNPLKQINMSKFKKKKGGELPAISTASLPDIVFMLLFFFMVATVMRDSTLMVANTLPAADQVQKLDKKDRVMYIYAGKPSDRYQDKFGTQPKIQLNDKFATVADVGAFILAERASKRQELQNVLTTALKVDGETNMGLITDIKQELRKVNALKINYTTRNGDYMQNLK
jgi:biopolymer transport protein ExbD